MAEGSGAAVATAAAGSNEGDVLRRASAALTGPTYPPVAPLARYLGKTEQNGTEFSTACRIPRVVEKPNEGLEQEYYVSVTTPLFEQDFGEQPGTSGSRRINKQC